MTEKFPIKLDKISKKLWPRKIYVKAKEKHPILGSVVIAFWTLLWTLLAIIVNLALIIVVVATILLFVYAILSDPSFDGSFSGFTYSRNNKNQEYQAQLHQQTTNFCSNCGKALDAGSKFCKNCGATQ